MPIANNALNGQCLAGIGIYGHESTIDAHRTTADTKPSGQHGFEAIEHGVNLAANHGVGRAAHASIGEVSGATRQHPLIRSRHMRVCADDGGHQTVEMPAHGHFLARGFGVEVKEDVRGFGLLQDLVSSRKRIVVLIHEDASAKVCDKEIDAWHQEARASSDPALRKAAYEKIARKFLAEGWILYLYHPQNLIAHTDRLEGYTPVPDGLIRVVGLRLK